MGNSMVITHEQGVLMRFLRLDNLELWRAHHRLNDGRNPELFEGI
jgi:hypothetical protein